ncbi:MAG: hypothetical protein GWP08_09705 [Nitrospiraceae bacterium]|nr:hypothetical protein [Nitrospiraceae bacterium]
MATSVERERDAFSELAVSRQNVYAYLARAFSAPPSSEEIRSLGNIGLLDEAASLFSDAMASALQQCAALAANGDEWESLARDEFMRLFKVPGAHYVMPYESVYRDTREIEGEEVTGLLMGESAVDVQKWYRLAALDISEDFKDLPDHIALELMYLAHLCIKEREFASAHDEAHLLRAWEMERDFLAAHVVAWIVPLRNKICEKTQHPYFRAVAELAVDFSRGDLATIEDLLGHSNSKSAPQYNDGAN